MKKLLFSTVFMIGLCCLLQTSFAQGIQAPKVSQKAKVVQEIGMSYIVVSYHRPAVKEREVWGKMVPYGQVWRAGANDNTVIKLSHEAKVGGQTLAAGTYGLHMIPTEKDWTIIFSTNSSSWGSYSYDEKEDALRVTVTPKEGPHHEFLTYSFENPTANSVDLTLSWEKLQVPISIAFDAHEIALASFSNQLRSTAGFSWQGFQQAANYCLTNEVNLEQGLKWADNAIAGGFGSQANFTTLSTKSQILAKMGNADEAKTTMDKALAMATDMELYGYGSQFIGQGQNEKAFEIYKLLAKRFPDTWIAHAGLAAGNRVTGNPAEALKHYKKAHEGAPDQWKPSLQTRIDSMKKELAGKGDK